jgi:hypothetical protein
MSRSLKIMSEGTLNTYSGLRFGRLAVDVVEGLQTREQRVHGRSEALQGVGGLQQPVDADLIRWRAKYMLDAKGEREREGISLPYPTRARLPPHNKQR